MENTNYRMSRNNFLYLNALSDEVIRRSPSLAEKWFSMQSFCDLTTTGCARFLCDCQKSKKEYPLEASRELI